MTTHARFVVQRSEFGWPIPSMIAWIVALMIADITIFLIDTLARDKRRQHPLLCVSSQLVDVIIMIHFVHICYFG